MKLKYLVIVLGYLVLFRFVNNTGNLSEDVYIKPWTRISPFLFGILLGYIAVQTKFNISVGKVDRSVN